MRGWMAKMMALALMGSATIAGAADCPVALDFYKRPLLDEKPVHLCEEFRGRVVLIVNTASKCAYTPQSGQQQPGNRYCASHGFSVDRMVVGRSVRHCRAGYPGMGVTRTSTESSGCVFAEPIKEPATGGISWG